VLEHVGVNHAGAEDLHPAVAPETSTSMLGSVDGKNPERRWISRSAPKSFFATHQPEVLDTRP
jgi:hypothetical protein